MREKAPKPLHQRLHAMLVAENNAGRITQESLGRAIGKRQESVGVYLRTGNGALDVDEADAALRHIGSSLRDFLDELPPRELPPTEKLARALASTPGLPELLRDLLDAQQTLLPALRGLAKHVAPLATERPPGRTPARRGESPEGRRTTKGPRPRR